MINLVEDRKSRLGDNWEESLEDSKDGKCLPNLGGGLEEGLEQEHTFTFIFVCTFPYVENYLTSCSSMSLDRFDLDVVVMVFASIPKTIAAYSTQSLLEFVMYL